MYPRTSMTLGWLSSRRYLTSRIADMSRPSLNCPTLIFLMATRRPVDFSRAEMTVVAFRRRTRSLWRERPTPVYNGVCTFTWWAQAVNRSHKKAYDRARKHTNLGLLQPLEPLTNKPTHSIDMHARPLTTSLASQHWLSRRHP